LEDDTSKAKANGKGKDKSNIEGADKGKDKGKGKGGKGDIKGGRDSKEKAQTKMRAQWWHKIEGDCPISLAPICELVVEPFALQAPGTEGWHYFDARILALYLVQACDFIDPVNRRPLLREECVALDEHVARNYNKNEQYVSVTDTYDIVQLNTGGTDQHQRDAASVLQHLFRFQSSRRTDVTGRSINFQSGGLTVIDDDDILAPAPHAPQNIEPDGFEPVDSFPVIAPAPKRQAVPRPYRADSVPIASQGEAFPELPASTDRGKGGKGGGKGGGRRGGGKGGGRR